MYESMIVSPVFWAVMIGLCIFSFYAIIRQDSFRHRKLKDELDLIRDEIAETVEVELDKIKHELTDKVEVSLAEIQESLKECMKICSENRDVRNSKDESTD